MRILAVALGLAVLCLTRCAADDQGGIEVGASAAAPQGTTTAPPALRPDLTAEFATDQAVGSIEPVAVFYGAMPTGVTVSRSGRMFVCFPRWGDNPQATVAEMHNGQPVAYPDDKLNRINERESLAGQLISVQSVVVDAKDRLWLLDTGSIAFGPTAPNGPKLIGIDLTTNHIFKKILFPPEVALRSTYLNDVRFDLRRGKEGMAFITDSSGTGPNAIIVVDLASGRSWRKLNDHPSVKAEPGFLPVVEGEPLMVRRFGQATEEHITVGSDGIAISPDGRTLYYCPLASRHLYSVATAALADEQMPDEQAAVTVEDLGEKGGGSDGLECDIRGRVYITDYEHNTILVRDPRSGRCSTLVHDPRILWPDTLCIAADGYLYFTVNQLHRQGLYHYGADLRRKPYVIFRTPVDAGPVALK